MSGLARVVHPVVVRADLAVGERGARVGLDAERLGEGEGARGRGAVALGRLALKPLRPRWAGIGPNTDRHAGAGALERLQVASVSPSFGALTTTISWPRVGRRSGAPRSGWRRRWRSVEVDAGHEHADEHDRHEEQHEVLVEPVGRLVARAEQQAQAPETGQHEQDRRDPADVEPAVDQHEEHEHADGQQHGQRSEGDAGPVASLALLELGARRRVARRQRVRGGGGGQDAGIQVLDEPSSASSSWSDRGMAPPPVVWRTRPSRVVRRRRRRSAWPFARPGGGGRPVGFRPRPP